VTASDLEKSKIAALTAQKLPAFEKENPNKNKLETKPETKILSQEIVEH